MKAPLVVIPDSDTEAFAAARLLNFGRALPDLLQRLGFGAWDACDLGELDAEALEERPLVLVAFAPDSMWSQRVLGLLCEYEGPLVLEGPLPEQAALRMLGLVVDGELEELEATVEPGKTEAAPAPAKKRKRRSAKEPEDEGLSKAFEHMPLPSGRCSFTPLWARASIEPEPVTRAELGSLRAGAFALDALDAVVSRLAERSFYTSPRRALSGATLLVGAATLLGDSDPAVAAYAPWRARTSAALLDLVSQTLEGEEWNAARAAAVIVARGEGFEVDPATIDLSPLGPYAGELMEFLLGAREYAEAWYPDDLEETNVLVARAGEIVLQEHAENPHKVRWAPAGTRGRRLSGGRRIQPLPLHRLAAVCLWGEAAGAPVDLDPLVDAGEAADTVLSETRRIRDMSRISRLSPRSRPAVVAGLERVRAEIGEDTPDEAAGMVRAYLAEAAASTAQNEALEELLAAEPEHGEAPGPEEGVSLLRVARLQLGGAGYGDELVTRWRRGASSFQRWISIGDGDGASTAVQTSADDEELPVVACDKQRVGIAFPLFTWLLAESAPPPAHPPSTYRVEPAAETWDLATSVLEAACAACGVPRRLAWPWPAAAAATVLHDLGEGARRRDLEDSLAWEARHQFASTYVLPAATLETPLRGVLEGLGHEIAAARGPQPPFRGLLPRLVDEDAEGGYAWLGWQHSGTQPAPLVLIDPELEEAKLLRLEGFGVNDRTPADAKRWGDHLLVTPEGAEEASAELRESAWWAPLAHVVKRTRDAAAIEASWDEGVLELRSKKAVQGLELVLGERDGELPCVLEGESTAGKLAAGPRPGSYSLDLAAGSTVRISWQSAAEEVSELTPSTEETPESPATLEDIRRRLDESGTRLAGRSSVEDAKALLRDSAALERARGIEHFLAAYGYTLEGKSLVTVGPGAGEIGLFLFLAAQMSRLDAFETTEERSARVERAVEELGLADVHVGCRPFELDAVGEHGADLVLLVDVPPRAIFRELVETAGTAVRAGGTLLLSTASPNGRPIRHFSPGDFAAACAESGLADIRYLGASGASPLVSPYRIQPFAPGLYLGARRPEEEPAT